MAIRFFQRAIQIDPYFTYAYTLLGHEYVMTEELDKAIACFRNAVRLDTRYECLRGNDQFQTGNRLSFLVGSRNLLSFAPHSGITTAGTELE